MRLPLLSLAALGGLGALLLRRTHDQIVANPDPAPPAVIGTDPPGRTRWIDRPDGTRIRVVEAGEGPTVVLAHGFGVSILAWSLVQPALVEAGYHVVAFDWRGHGRTTIGTDGVQPEVIAEDYVAVFEEMDLTDAVLVGHSTGGYLAIATLLDHPAFADRLAGLVLFGSFAGEALKDAPQNRLQIPLIKSGVFGAVLRTELIGLPFAASIYGPDPSPAACRAFLEDFQQTDLEGVLPLLDRLATTGFYDRMGEIDVPTVVVCGEHDHTTPRWHSEALGRDIPGARNVWVAGGGHGINWSHPESLVEVVNSLSSSAAPMS
jgi:pimeloyl-ACP methyl ester carboxylesterase